MAALKDVIAYILQHYPHRHELSDARVTKMVYLSDWKHVLETGEQATPIRWYFHNYGPYVRDVLDTARDHPHLFRIAYETNAYGDMKKVLDIQDPSYQPRLTESERQAIDHVIEVTKPLTWDPFIGLVYSTHPIVSSERYSFLDLKKAAREYKESRVYNEVSPRK